MSENQESAEMMLAIIYASTDTSAIKWKEAATLLGIQDQPTLTAGAKLQRKFKKIVENSGRYSLEKGKLILKNGSTNAPSTPDTPATPATPSTPKSSGAPKKRGRPAGTPTAQAKKKTKKADTEDEVAEEVKDHIDRNGDHDEDEDDA